MMITGDVKSAAISKNYATGTPAPTVELNAFQVKPASWIWLREQPVQTLSNHLQTHPSEMHTS